MNEEAIKSKALLHAYETPRKAALCGHKQDLLGGEPGVCYASLRDLLGDGNRPLYDWEVLCQECEAHPTYQEWYALYLLRELP